MGISAIEPELGEWYRVPQSVIRVANQYSGSVPHRWIVASRPFAGQVHLVLRTTTPTYSDVEHAKHDPTHAPRCAIDKNGYVCNPAELQDTYLLGLGDFFSCIEPDEAVIDQVRGFLPPMRPRNRRRSR